MTQSTAITKPFAQALVQHKTSITSLLPEGTDYARFCRIAINQILRNPYLAKTTPESFVMACMQIAETQLDPALQECAIVPYKDEAQYQPMYQGLVALAYRSGNVRSCNAYAVYEGDTYRVVRGTSPQILHEEGPRETDQYTHVYAVVELVSGGVVFESMSRAEVLKVRDNTAGWKSGRQTPWRDHEIPMALKTVTKRVLKLIPKATRDARALAAAIHYDDMAEVGKRQVPSSITPDSDGDLLSAILQSGGEADIDPQSAAPAAGGVRDQMLAKLRKLEGFPDDASVAKALGVDSIAKATNAQLSNLLKAETPKRKPRTDTEIASAAAAKAKAKQESTGHAVALADAIKKVDRGTLEDAVVRWMSELPSGPVQRAWAAIGAANETTVDQLGYTQLRTLAAALHVVATDAGLELSL